MTDGRDIEPFCTLAAPGLDEDDLFAAMYGMPGEGALWGAGRPTAFRPAETGWQADEARRARHRELLRRWSPIDGGGATGRSGRPSV